MQQFNSLREKIAFEKEQRQARYRQFEQVTEQAHNAGMLAVQGTECPVMVVKDPRTGQAWTVPEGPCGFAYVTLRKSNTSFAIWAKKKGIFQKGYSGTQLWVSDFNQSVTLKSAYAQAYARVLNENGIECYSGSRLD